MNRDEIEFENNASGQDEREVEEESKIKQTYSLFEITQANESIKRYIERTRSCQKTKQSQHSAHTRKRNQKTFRIQPLHYQTVFKATKRQLDPKWIKLTAST